MDEQDEMVLRKLLWLRHGCSLESLYGDDGEMQCNTCRIDFKRDAAKAIADRFSDIGVEMLKRSLPKIIPGRKVD